MKKTIVLSLLAIAAISGVANAYETVNYYDKWGAKTGSASEDYNGNVSYYDKWGAKTGSAREDYNGNVSYYDKWGAKTGSAR
jgi:hypothetical protein